MSSFTLRSHSAACLSSVQAPRFFLTLFSPSFFIIPCRLLSSRNALRYVYAFLSNGFFPIVSRRMWQLCLFARTERAHRGVIVRARCLAAADVCSSLTTSSPEASPACAGCLYVCGTQPDSAHARTHDQSALAVSSSHILVVEDN